MMVDFKFDALSLHREPHEVGLVKKVILKFVLVGGAGCAIPI